MSSQSVYLIRLVMSAIGPESPFSGLPLGLADLSAPRGQDSPDEP